MPAGKQTTTEFKKNVPYLVGRLSIEPCSHSTIDGCNPLVRGQRTSGGGAANLFDSAQRARFLEVALTNTVQMAGIVLLRRFFRKIKTLPLAGATKAARLENGESNCVKERCGALPGIAQAHF